MYKFLLLTCTFLMTTTVSAKTCIGGQIVHGRDTSRSYCISDNSMNWWTAFEWCKSNNRTLAHPDNLCSLGNDVGWFLDMGGCPNFNWADFRNFNAWTSIPLNENRALAINFNSAFSAQRDVRYQAFCD